MFAAPLLFVCVVSAAAPQSAGPLITPPFDEPAATAPIPPDAPAPEPPPAPVAAPDAVPTPPAGARPLERGLFFLDELEVESAVLALRNAEQARDYSLDDVVRLYTALGTALALAGDEPGARAAFEKLLGYDEHATVSYRASSRVTIIFEEARRARATLRTPEVVLIPPVATRLGERVPLTLRRAHDPNNSMQHWVLWYRVAGDDTFSEVAVAVPAVGRSIRVELPAVSDDRAQASEGDLRGAFLEVALTARNDKGWVVFEAPSTTRPLEIPVGFDAPPPWYLSGWFVGLVSAGAVAAVASFTGLAAAGGVVAFIRSRPPDVISEVVVNNKEGEVNP